MNTFTKIIFYFRRKGLERLTFSNEFYENQLIGFVDIAMSSRVFLNVAVAILVTLSHEQNRKILISRS